MAITESHIPPDANLAFLLSSLSLTTSPATCNADAYLTEPEILRAYKGQYPTSLPSLTLLICF